MSARKTAAATIIDKNAAAPATLPRVTGYKQGDTTKAALSGIREKFAMVNTILNALGKLGLRDEILSNFDLATGSPFADSDGKTSLSITWKNAPGSGARDPQKLEQLLRKKKLYRQVTREVRLVDEVLLNKAVQEGKITLADLEACKIPATQTPVLKLDFSDPTDKQTVVENIETLISVMLDPKNDGKNLRMVAEDPSVLLQQAK